MFAAAQVPEYVCYADSHTVCAALRALVCVF